MSEIKSVSMRMRIVLSLVYFLEYMVQPVWYITLVPYLKKLGAEGQTIALIISTVAVGNLAAPFVGMVTDRFFTARRVMVTLNLITAVGLVLVGVQTKLLPLMLIMLGTMVCYMPTWSTINYTIMTHCPPNVFLQIRVFGVLGWISGAIFSVVGGWFGIEVNGTPLMFYCGAAAALAAAGFSLLIPHTPPKAAGQPMNVVDMLGLRAVKLMREPSFLIFILVMFLSKIPFSLYFSYGGEFLTDMGFSNPTLSMSFGQYSEIFFTLLLASAIRKIGVKHAMGIGLAALVMRYVLFWFGGSGGIYGGILIHGLIFGFLYTGSQLYVDTRAEPAMRAQAQGFINFAVSGLGSFLSLFVSRAFIDKLRVTTTDAQGLVSSNWSQIWLLSTGISLFLLLIFVFFFHPKERESPLKTES